MLEIGLGDEGVIVLAGRLDASQSEKAQSFLDSVADASILDFSNLEYISSAGLGVLLKTQKRIVAAAGSGLKIVNVSNHINDIFRYSGFDKLFVIRTA